MNIIIIAAHPDDEVLGCGGSIAKWAKDGHKENCDPEIFFKASFPQESS